MKKITVLLCLFITLSVSAQNWYVKPVATGFGNGSSWANAIDLQTALANASNNDVLWLATGTYTPHASSRSTYFTISARDLEIYGGFAGTETAVTQRVLGANETILSGDLDNNDVNITNFISNYSNVTRNADNSYHIIEIAYNGSGVLLDGLTISGAHNNLSATEQGGAILKENSVKELSLKNCIIKDNVSRNGNAGLYADFQLNNLGGTRAELNIENCQFINNMSRWGSCIYSEIQSNANIDVTITNTLFDNNVTGNLNASTAQGLSGSVGWFRMSGNTCDVNLKFINNTIVNNLDDGTDQSLDATSHAVLGISKANSGLNGAINAEIANNIFWNNKTTGNAVTKSITDLYLEPVASVNVYNSIDENNFTDSSITSTTSISNANPLFTSASDYTLQSGSPALNTGDNSKILAGITKDLAGNQRIINTTVDMGVYENTTLITTWVGSPSNSWNLASNWTNGVPTATVNAVIPNVGSNYPIIRSVSMVVRDLEIQAGGTLLIDGGKTLTIEGNLTQNGTFNITSDSSLLNHGSLILKGSATGNVSYNREVTSNWHLLTSPVEGQSIAAFKNDVSDNGTKYAIAPYVNTLATNRYNYYTTAAGTNDVNTAGNFVKGKGYSIQRSASGIFSFEGTLNTIDVPMAITDGSATGNKWNLVGNPFTSSIYGNTNAHAANNFLTVNANELDPVRVAMYVWNASSSSYDIVNNTTTSKHIAPTQAFFVESKNGGGALQFTEAMQNHQGNAGSSSKTSNTVPSIKLLVSNGSLQKSTDVKYYNTATIGLDPGYDAGVFSGEAQVFNVYTKLLSNDTSVGFGIQSLPTNNYDAMVIPLGVNAVANTALSFTAAIENLPSGINVYIEDKVENTFTLLDTVQANYTTTVSTAVKGFGRFYLHTTSGVLSVDTNITALNSIHIYKSNTRTLNITGLANQEQNSVTVYTILGKEVFNTSIKAQQKTTIELPRSLSTGVYLIKLQTANGSVNKKVILN